MPRKTIEFEIGDRRNNYDYMKQFQFDIKQMGLSVSQEWKALGIRLAAEILRIAKKNTRVDMGFLRNSWKIKQSIGYIDVFNNAKYAAAWEYGWQQVRRWVPGKWVGSRFIYDKNAKTGMMLKEKKHEGDFMLKNAVKESEDAFGKFANEALDKAAMKAFRRTGYRRR